MKELIESIEKLMQDFSFKNDVCIIDIEIDPVIESQYLSDKGIHRSTVIDYRLKIKIRK